MAENKFYWLKLQNDFFKRHDIKIIEAMPNGKDYVLFYLKLLLESVSHYGRLRFSETIPYNENMLATITDTNIDTVRNAMKLFIELHLIELLDDKTIFMREVEKMLGTESKWAQYKRKPKLETEETPLLENKPAKLENFQDHSKDVPKHSKNVPIDIDIDIDIDKELDKDINKKRKSVNSGVNDVIKSFADNENIQTLLFEFVEMRKTMKKPLTVKAIELAINKLRDKPQEQQQLIIEKTLEHNWITFYELKPDEVKRLNKPSPTINTEDDGDIY